MRQQSGGGTGGVATGTRSRTAEARVVVVHEGVVYEAVVDTSHASPEVCAARIASKLLSGA